MSELNPDELLNQDVQTNAARKKRAANNVELKGTWNVSGNEYNLYGTGPQLSFDVNMGIGNLELISQP